MDELSKHCLHGRKALFQACKRLRSILVTLVAKIEDKTLVRAEIGDVRVKELASLRRKLRKTGWQAREALSICGDLVGGRVVCNNTEDVYRFVELLREALPSASATIEVQDQIREPNPVGYRAFNVNSRLDVGGLLRTRIVCRAKASSRTAEYGSRLENAPLRGTRPILLPTRQ